MIFPKKILLASILCASTPILPIVITANSYQRSNQLFKLFVGYNGQADILLSLQIHPDYYPYQFKQEGLYDYISDAQRYMVSNASVSSKKQALYSAFQTRLNSLISKISSFGPSLWNNDLYDSGIVYRNTQFWLDKKTKYLFLEQFINDDYVNESALLNAVPQHHKVFTTNFRLSRDPYLVFPKSTFDYFNTRESGTAEQSNDNAFDKAFYKYYKTYDLAHRNALYRFAKFMIFWQKNIELNAPSPSSPSSQPSSSASTNDKPYSIAAEDEKLFDIYDEENDKKIAALYQDTIFSPEELALMNSWGSSTWKINYLNKKSSTVKAAAAYHSTKSIEVRRTKPNPKIIDLHHPSLEHQTIKGSSPLSEGSQKDVMIYLMNLSLGLEQMTKDADYSATFANDTRKEFVDNAKNNAELIACNYKQRIKHIRKYFQDIGVIDGQYDPDSAGSSSSNQNSKSLAIITYPPVSVGGGNASIQSISKFPFIYKDLGFKQVLPDISDTGSHDHPDHEHHHDEDVFSVDDNGWWWNIGNSNINKNNLNKLKNKADSVIFLANHDDWNIINGGDSPKIHAYYSVLKNSHKQDYSLDKVGTSNFKLTKHSYNLWNEGLRSPIALNLVLDNLVEIIRKQYGKATSEHTSTYQSALDWGDYWETHFAGSTNKTSSSSSCSTAPGP